MTDLIYPPFTLHRITVGPNLEAAQIGPNSTGLYVETLQTWLRLFSLLSSNSAYNPDPPPTADQAARYGAQTASAVAAFRSLVGLPAGNSVDTDTWNFLQEELIRPRFAVGAKPALPPNPNERRRPFPRRDQPNYDQELLLGLRNFGFDFSETETGKAVRLFQCLARNTRYYQTTRIVGEVFEDESRWSELWNKFEHTWGRFLGAPWLGIVAPDITNIWGTRPTFRLLYDIGRKYLDAATDESDLRRRLATPIRVQRVASRLGEPHSAADEHTGREATFALPDDPGLTRRWGDAISATKRAVMISANNQARALTGPPTAAAGLASVVTITSRPITRTSSAHVKWAEYIFYHTALAHLSNFLDIVTNRYVIDLAIGRYNEEPWRMELPDRLISLINGRTSPYFSTCTLLVRGLSLDSNRIASQPGVPLGSVTLHEIDERQNTLSHHLNSIGIVAYRLELSSSDILPDTSYAINIYDTLSIEPIKTWDTRTLPAITSEHPITFLAASCYSDFATHNANEDYVSPGAKYTSSLTALQTNSFLSPRFKTLLGDNIYLDVAPDWSKLSAILSPSDEIVGRYIRYFACSEYAQSLSMLPAFAIPDDHEYWNDYPRTQAHILRSFGHPFFPRYTSAAKSSLRLFQGAMCATAPSATPNDGDVSDFTYTITVPRRRLPSAPSFSMFFFDATSQRKYGETWDTPVYPDRLTTDDTLQQLQDWASSLQGPGILLIGQPIFCPGKFSKLGIPTLASDYLPSHFYLDFSSLCTSLINSPWDIAIISGDVHWNRLINTNGITPHHYIRQGRTHNPYLTSKISEIITSPAQRLPNKLGVFLGSYKHLDYGPAKEIYTTAPWASEEGDFPSVPGPRVTSSSYEDATLGIIRWQSIGANAVRIDSAFTVDGEISKSAPVRIDPLRWIRSNEWITPLEPRIPLYRDYEPPVIVDPDSIRDGFPFGSSDAKLVALLPRSTIGGTLVRHLERGEQFKVERVLFQAERAQAEPGAPVRLEYQCVEVRDVDGALCFLWTMRDSHELAAPISESRVEPHWSLPGDIIEATTSEQYCFSGFERGGNVNQANVRPHYPNGSFDDEQQPASTTALLVGNGAPITRGTRLLVHEIVLQSKRIADQQHEEEYEKQFTKVSILGEGDQPSSTSCFVTTINNGISYFRPVQPRPGRVRWCLPGEWLAVTITPLELFRNFRIGDAASPETVRPFYPHGSSDSYEHHAFLPPRADNQVRDLEPGELLFVKRVLYQAARTHRRAPRGNERDYEFEYQCVEVATTKQGEDATTAQLGASYFVWTIYNGVEHTERAPHHLYSTTLRCRMPWIVAGDRVRTKKGGAKLWRRDLVQWPENVDHSYQVFEEGHIVRAPFTGTQVREVNEGEELLVSAVFFQAEQVFLAGEQRHAGPYQVLEVQASTDGAVGLYWSMYDGDQWAELIWPPGTEPSSEREEEQEKQDIDQELAWLRTQAHLFTRTNNPRDLELVLALPETLAQAFRRLHPHLAVTDHAFELCILRTWLQTEKLTAIRFLGNIITTANMQQMTSEQMLKSLRLYESVDYFLKFISDLINPETISEIWKNIIKDYDPGSTLDHELIKLVSSPSFVLRRNEYRTDFARILLNAVSKLPRKFSDLERRGSPLPDRRVLRDMFKRDVQHHHRTHEDPLPTFQFSTREAVIVQLTSIPNLPSVFLLLSDITVQNDRVVFDYWPNHEGGIGKVTVASDIHETSFRAGCRDYLEVFRTPLDDTPPPPDDPPALP